MKCKSKCAKIALMVVVGIAALGWLVMALWNWLIPALFVGGREIGYLQAIGLLVLSKILFGGFRGHGGFHGRLHRHHLEQLTPEERERLQSGWHRWACRSKPANAETKGAED